VLTGAARHLPGLPGAEQHLARERHREIERLLHLLETDPDTGLRHALPLRTLPHRGRGKPGSKLGKMR